MSTVDEVLATAEVVDAVCIIDGETRIISVPTEYKELGVESDEKVTRVKFQCPKIVGDNIDLTEYNLYINYKNADNKLNSYLVEDVTVADDTINFSWLLSRHVTESPGTINYIVCAKKSDYTGVINEWNTKVATGTVGVGLEATEEIEEQNIDIIEQILRSIVELENKVDGGGSGGSGLTTAQVNALDGMFKVCAFIKADVSAEYTAFKTAFGITDSGGDSGGTEVTLTSISATYDGGDVAVGTAVTDLTGIVVTAHYSDGSTAEVTGYALSGTIVEGSNTITVSYSGKTATFTVTGVADTTGDNTNKNLLYSWDFTKSLTDSLSGEIATLNGSATQDSDGVHLTALTDYIGLGGLVTAVNRAYELNIGDMERSGNQHGRLLAQDGTAGFMYRNSGYWTWWSGQGWCESTGLTGFADIANKTIRIEVDASGYHTLYVDGSQIAKSSLPVGNGSSTGGILEGLAMTLGSPVNQSAAISTIKAFRVYNLGGE